MAAVKERGTQRVVVMPLDLDLPIIDTPQYVNEEGYEVDAQTFALSLQEAAGELKDGEPYTQIPRDSGDVLDNGNEVEETGEEEQGEAGVEEDQVVTGEPLLGLAESNLLHYSLVAARQHHLQSLLPLAFSHPPIPANSRPRARPPPKGTFLYPTPPPLVHPLPHREYHAPTQSSSKPSAATTPIDQQDTGDKPEVKRRKYGRKGKDKSDEVEPPAHEIECIARVTLSIGAISFPDTEIWVGRFVQPRASAPKPTRTKLDPAEKQRLKDERIAAKRAKQLGPPTSSHPAAYRPIYRPPVAGPSHQGYRPRPPAPTAPSQPGVGRPPQQPRTELSPDLIRRVNEAATKHPWLSQIIHKAARTQATKEELAKLGRVVNRLKEGKDVGEDGETGPLPSASVGAGPSQPRPIPTGSAAPNPAATRPPVATAGPAARPPHVPTTTRSPKSASSEALTPPPGDGSEDDDSGSDVDMTGPEQVGGGPVGAADPDSGQQSAGLAASPLPVPNGPPPTMSNQVPLARPPSLGNHPLNPHTGHPTASQRDSSSFASPPPSNTPPYNPAYPMPPHVGMRPPGHSTPLAPPPPPRPTYPFPPPFLLLAFKEAPTEKFLFPLGSLSYMSRVGEKDEDLALPPAQGPAPGISGQSTAQEPLQSAAGPSRPSSAASRTRGTLRQGSEVQASKPEGTLVADANLEADSGARSKGAARSGLSPLPGMAPPNGTVLISTFTPAREWKKPDWHDLAKCLPFNNPAFGRPTLAPSAVKSETDADGANGIGVSTKESPSTSPQVTRKRPSPGSQTAKGTEPALPVKSHLLNIATECFFPDEGDVQAITIRLEHVSDHTWQRLKTINGMVTTAEMKALSEQSPHLMDKVDFHSEPNVTSPVVPTVPVQFQPTARLREEYTERKRNLFRRLLKRVPPRRFLRYRIETPRPDIIDATTDKWAPKPYHISTKALGNRENDYDDQVIPLASETQPKKGNKKALEPEVTFEMPVSLDQLDEMVAENALKGKRGKGEDGRKGKGRRWVPGTICQGCGLANKRVWRSGPGGKSTLCNSCGDKFTAGELGPLIAPGAPAEQNTSGDQPEVKEEGKGPDAIGGETGPDAISEPSLTTGPSAIDPIEPASARGSQIVPDIPPSTPAEGAPILAQEPPQVLTATADIETPGVENTNVMDIDQTGPTGSLASPSKALPEKVMDGPGAGA